MTLYKLTDGNDQTFGGCQWGEGVTVTTSGTGEMCGTGFTHWYTHPLLAVLLNPIHANIDLTTAHLWEGEGEVVKTDHGLKVGCTTATTLRRVALPQVTTEQRVRFGILCAMEVYADPDWHRWANDWLAGKDRSARAARSAWVWAASASDAAWAAAWAAATWAASASDAAWAAAWAAAANAAEWAAGALDFAGIAERAVDDSDRAKSGELEEDADQ